MKLKNSCFRTFGRFLLLGTMFPLLVMSSRTKKIAMESSQKARPNIIFLIADDWSYPHAGYYGDPLVRTPTFDWLAAEGAVFDNAYCASPSCSPSRASILLGRYPHQMESAGNLWSVIPKKFKNWMSLLQESGYYTGRSRKGWGPGDYKAGGYQHNPAGKEYGSFKSFLENAQKDAPFAFWFGSNDPHRTYERNSGAKTGMDIDEVIVPDFLLDVPCVRNDMLDYYFEVERFDRESGAILKRLRKEGLLDNTIVVMTSDNGMPFPRAKANLYDYGTRMPLAMYWKGRIEGGKRISEFVNFIDFAPTFLEAAGIEVPKSFVGQTLLPLFEGETGMAQQRDTVFLERERHANVRKGNLSYPARAVRTEEYLYIKNFEPDRWPAGDPKVHQSVGQYGDVDNSISKFLIMQMEGKADDRDYFDLSFGKRPAEELYVLAKDPYNLQNEVENPEHEVALKRLRNALKAWMEATGDLRAKKPRTDYWDNVEYTPDYQRSNVNVRDSVNAYRMLLRDKGGFMEIPCSDD